VLARAPPRNSEPGLVWMSRPAMGHHEIRIRLTPSVAPSTSPCPFGRTLNRQVSPLQNARCQRSNRTGPDRIGNRNWQLRPRATYKVHLSILGHLCLYTYISNRTTEVVRHTLRSFGGWFHLGGSNRVALWAAT
jgi:hypothetical protein